MKTGRTVISLLDINDVWKCWTKLFGLIPVFPNSLAVSTVKGKTYRFVMFGRDKWITAIRESKQDLEERADRGDSDDEQDDLYEE